MVCENYIVLKNMSNVNSNLSLPRCSAFESESNITGIMSDYGSTAGDNNVGTAGENNVGTAGENNVGTAGENNVGTAGENNVGTAGENNVGTSNLRVGNRTDSDSNVSENNEYHEKAKSKLFKFMKTSFSVSSIFTNMQLPNFFQFEYHCSGLQKFCKFKFTGASLE